MEIIESNKETVTLKLRRPDLVALSVVLNGVTERFGLDLEDELSSANLSGSKIVDLCNQLNEMLESFTPSDLRDRLNKMTE